METMKLTTANRSSVSIRLRQTMLEYVVERRNFAPEAPPLWSRVWWRSGPRKKLTSLRLITDQNLVAVTILSRR